LECPANSFGWHQLSSQAIRKGSNMMLTRDSAWMVGAGAVGGYIAAHLARAGHHMHLVDAWQQHVDEINSRGLLIEEVAERFKVHLSASGRCQGLPRLPPEVVVLACKIQDLHATVDWLEDVVDFRGLYLATLNGLADFDLASRVGNERVMGCIVSGLHGQLVKPGHIKRYVPRSSERPVYRVANVSGPATLRVREWADMLGLVDTAVAVDDLKRERWTKLQYNAMTSALSAVSGLPIQKLCLEPEWRSVMVSLGREVAAVAAAEGISLGSICGIPPGDWLKAGTGDDDALKSLGAGLIAYGHKMSPTTMSGVAYDFQRGRQTEVDSLNGLVIAKGESLGVDVPANRKLRDTLVSLQREHRWSG
jgi:2-dehydropantoate 2-reductase